MSDKEDNDVKKEGAFVGSLKRNAKQIREDRANLISGDTEMIYRRKVEDIEKDIRALRYRREALIDLAPSDSMSTVVAPKEFDPDRYAQEDIAIGVQLRNLEITLEIAKDRYTYLFGGK